MHTTDPDFEAMKAITRLSWLLDMTPVSEPAQPSTAAGVPSRHRA